MPAATKLSEIVALRIEGKKQHAKRSIFSACKLLIENHILPSFGEIMLVEEQDVQTFVFRKLDEGLSQKIVKVILIVLKTRTRFGIKKQMETDLQAKMKKLQSMKAGTRQTVNRYFKSFASKANHGICPISSYVQESGYLLCLSRQSERLHNL